MSRYRTWPVSKWDREPFRSMDPMDRYTYLAIHQGPYSTALPGVSVSGLAAMAEVTDLADFAERIEGLQRRGVVVADVAGRVLVLPDAIDEAMPTNPNVVKAWRSAFDELPDGEAKRVIDARIRQLLLNHGERTPAKVLKDDEPSAFAWIRMWDPEFREPSGDVPATFAERLANGPRSVPLRSRPVTGTEPAPAVGPGSETASRKGEQEEGRGETIGGNLPSASRRGGNWTSTRELARTLGRGVS